MERGVGHEIPTLTEELLATDSCWESESQYFFQATHPVVYEQDTFDLIGRERERSGGKNEYKVGLVRKGGEVDLGEDEKGC